LINHPSDKFDLLDFENVKSFKVLKKSTLRELKAKTEVSALWIDLSRVGFLIKLFRKSMVSHKTSKDFGLLFEEETKLQGLIRHGKEQTKKNVVFFFFFLC